MLAFIRSWEHLRFFYIKMMSVSQKMRTFATIIHLND